MGSFMKTAGERRRDHAFLQMMIGVLGKRGISETGRP